MAAPIVALDVDGVVCPLREIPTSGGVLPTGADDWGDWQAARVGGGAPVSAALGAAIRELAAEVYWVSSWSTSEIAPVAEAMGLPGPEPVAPADAGKVAWRKARQVLTLLESRPPALVWADDHLRRHAGDVVLVGEAAASAGVPLLCVCPVPQVGLSDCTLESIRHFLVVESLQSVADVWRADLFW